MRNLFLIASTYYNCPKKSLSACLAMVLTYFFPCIGFFCASLSAQTAIGGITPHTSATVDDYPKECNICAGHGANDI